MVPQKHNPTKMPNGEWHWTINGDIETYILATSPDAKRYTLVFLKDGRNEEHRVSEIPEQKERYDGFEAGLYDWVKKAISIHSNALKERKEETVTKVVEIDGGSYKIEYESRNGNIQIYISATVIVSNRSTLTNTYQELIYTENGRLMSRIIDLVAENWEEKEDQPEQLLKTPISFNSIEEFEIEDRLYGISYDRREDLLLLILPDRVLETHEAIYQSALRELSEIAQGRLIKEVQNFVSVHQSNKVPATNNLQAS